MKLILIQHGETVENHKRIIQGQKLPGTLTNLGKEQARKVALRLKKEKVDIIYSSDLGRAKDTTKEIIKFHPNIPIHYTQELREISRGIFDGKSKRIVQEHEKKIKGDLFTYKWEQGESYQEVQKRMVKVYQEIIKKNQDKIIVGHGGSLNMLLLYLCNKSFKNYLKFSVKHTAITIFEVIDNKPLLKLPWY